MKISDFIIGPGIIFLVFGIIFHLQGLSIIGPEESFMYSNPKWITNGIQIGVVGVFIIGVGISVRVFKRK
ncbi:MAG TPA: hypothetical protein QF518_02250 [Nitrosopumilus sp.]|jgi:hypothetical protein|nr:hypothetical protein [Nitrososphaerota archaeon]MDP6326968.1 hypothetical protein [Nitrosopumilus sp.]HJL67998.1 hypothetical protein [Nitrosopumilus sp.]HJM25170.1 hypothetical protein [Nitrosopumilus sp.]HJO31431.1 hypothetical protein [Nitrosopumilus sp.]|tara:strand:- start:174 stop:383 length:210 start_codon:yes stop_codon:yes gene_type:complete